MSFLVIYDCGPESTHVFQIHCDAENAEQAISTIKGIFPEYRILGVLLLNSKHSDNLINNFKYAMEVEDSFRNTIRDNIVSYEKLGVR